MNYVDDAGTGRCAEMDLKSTIACPSCGHTSAETMPTNACRFFYDCKGCGQRLKPLAGDCCVFCSFGSVPCPRVQERMGALLYLRPPHLAAQRRLLALFAQ